MSDIIMVYVTMPSEEVAKEIVRALLEKHLIACATMWPCKSMYWWEGAIQEDGEYIVLAKTREDAFEAIKTAISAMHPYQIPCILKLNATANEAYAKWVQEHI